MVKFQTLEMLDGKRENNYDLIRLIAASLVIYSHSYPLTGNNPLEPLGKLTGDLSFGGLAVAIFFVISGFLVTKSYLKNDDLLFFLKSRMLRIFPGLSVSMLFCGFFIGTLVTTLPLHEYFLNREVYSFIYHNITLHNLHWDLPGVFATNIYKNGVNGSIWTLPIEFCLYLIIAALGVLSLLKKPLICSTVIVLSVVLMFICFFFFNSTFESIISDGWLMNATCFAVGSLCFLLKRYCFINQVILIGLIAVSIMALHTKFFLMICCPTICYAVFYFSYHPFFNCKFLTRHGDFSYGLYIYGFPIQQVVSHYLHFSNPLLLFFVAYPLALIIAILSWKFIEKPALSFKKKSIIFALFNRSIMIYNSGKLFLIGCKSFYKKRIESA